jgi:hypothetical protein
MALSDSVSLPEMVNAPSYWGWEDDVRTDEEVREDDKEDDSSSGSEEASSDPDDRA